MCLCRCEISKNLCCRNLAVEKAVSELPTECTFCLKQFPRSSLERHQKEECQDRYTPHTHTLTYTTTPFFFCYTESVNSVSKLAPISFPTNVPKLSSQTATNSLIKRVQAHSGCKEVKQKHENGSTVPNTHND